MEDTKIDLSQYQNDFSRKNQVLRMVWTITWAIFLKPLPRSTGNSWKIFLLNFFGAKIGKGTFVYSSVKI